MNLIINGNEVREEIAIPYELIEKKQKEYFEISKSYNIDDINYDELNEKETDELEERFNEFYEWKKENFINYFTPYIIAFYLKEYYKVTDDNIKIDVTKYYLKDTDYSKLQEIDKSFLKKVDSDYSDKYIDKEINWLYFSRSGCSFYKREKDEILTDEILKDSDYEQFKDGYLYVLPNILKTM